MNNQNNTKYVQITEGPYYSDVAIVREAGNENSEIEVAGCGEKNPIVLPNAILTEITEAAYRRACLPPCNCCSDTPDPNCAEGQRLYKEAKELAPPDNDMDGLPYQGELTGARAKQFEAALDAWNFHLGMPTDDEFEAAWEEDQLVSNR